MGNDYRNSEAEIDLVGMFFYVLKKWRVIIIFGVIGLILGCGFSYYKMIQMDPANLEAYFEKLEAKDASAINEDNIAIYLDYKALYDGLLEYGNKSVVLNMNPNEVYAASANFYYSCEDIKTTESFFNSFLSTEAYESLVEASGLECETNDIKDMVGFWFSKTVEANLIVDSAYREEEQTGKLSISAFAPTQEALDGMMIQLRALVESANKELKQNGIKFETYLLNENESYGYSSLVVNKQQTFFNDRVSYLKNATTYMDKLSDDEKLYISYFYPNENSELKSGFSKKYPVLIAIAFAFLCAIFYAIIFIFDTHINSICELPNNFFTIANFQGEKKKGIDKFVDSWAKSREASINDINYFIEYLAQSNYHQIGLCFDVNDEYEKNMINTIKERVKENICDIENIALNYAGYANVAKSEELIAFVHLGVTRKKDFLRMCEVCEQLGKKIEKIVVIK